uniref:Uncharacterized protein n=1 Tax=Aegilops tauschii TaxID=37682 RepID=M8D4I2_AEGTA
MASTPVDRHLSLHADREEGPIIWLHDFQMFEDKSSAINLTTRRLGAKLAQMIMKCSFYDDKLVVGRSEYKEIIEESLGLTCVYNDHVMEVMWGLQNLMHTSFPEEKSKMSRDDQLLVSKGLYMVLDRHGIKIKAEMLNEHIIKKTRDVRNTDLREDAVAIVLHEMVDAYFEEFSKIDTEEWSLFKLALALKVMIDPHGGLKAGDPYEMFTHDELIVMGRDASKYEGTLDKKTVLAMYNDAVVLREDKMDLLYELDCLVEEAKGALETEEVLEKLATLSVDSKQQTDCTSSTAVSLTVPNQSSIYKEQHCPITDADGAEISPTTPDEVTAERDAVRENTQAQETTAEGRKEIGTAEGRMNLGTAEGRMNLGTAGGRINLGTAEGRKELSRIIAQKVPPCHYQEWKPLHIPQLIPTTPYGAEILPTTPNEVTAERNAVRENTQAQETTAEGRKEIGHILVVTLFTTSVFHFPQQTASVSHFY